MRESARPIPESLLGRLRSQLDALPEALGEATPDRFMRRPPSGAWSAHENLAHVGRYHEVMLERIERILNEDQPKLSRYRAEDDPRWGEWTARGPSDVLGALADLRSRLVARVEALSAVQLERVGVHPSFGRLTLSAWLEFFVLHEAHHLYVVFTRARAEPHASAAPSSLIPPGA